MVLSPFWSWMLILAILVAVVLVVRLIVPPWCPNGHRSRPRQTSWGLRCRKCGYSERYSDHSFV